MRDTNFAIQIDESTDISRDKGLAVIVRFPDPDTGHTCSKLWDMIKVFEDGKQAKATAERLFNCLVSTFEEYDVPPENIFACCFDGCSTMTGRKTGLKAKLEAAIPGIICVRCPAHSTHLCVMHALHEIPNKIMTLFNNINAMLKSSNRVHDFTEVQRELGLPEHKILKLCMTRWLSLEKVSARYVE